MAEPSNSPPLDKTVTFVFEGIALGFFYAPAESITNGGTDYGRYAVACLIGIILAYAGVKWPSWKTALPERVSDSLQRWANDARTWFAILFILWVYVVIPPVIALIRGEPSLSRLQAQVQQIRTDVDCYAMPRRISLEDQNKIAKELRKYEPHQFAFTVESNDDEAGQLGIDLSNALQHGGWTMSGITYSSRLRPGLSVEAQNWQTTDPNHPSAFQVLLKAFKDSKVALDGDGPTGGSGPSSQVMILIGPRRRDTHSGQCPSATPEPTPELSGYN